MKIKKIFKKLGLLMFVRLFAIGLTFLQTIFITRVFGSEVFGQLSFALSVSALLVLLFSGGMDQVIMREIARVGIKNIRSSHSWRLICAALRKFTIPLAIVGLSLIIFFIYAFLQSSFRLSLLFVIALIPLVLIRKYSEAINQGSKNILKSIFGSQVVYPLFMILGCIISASMSLPSNIQYLSLIYLVAVILSTFVAIFFVLVTINSTTEVRTVVEENISGSTQRTYLNSGFHFALVSLGFIIGQHIDVLLMGFFSTADNVGLVRIAARVAEMAGLMRAIVVLQYKPLLAEAVGRNDKTLIQNHSKFMMNVYVLTGIPITLFCWIFAEEVMSVFGSEFVNGAWAMRIYLGGVLVTLIMGPSNSLLAMSGNEALASKILFQALSIQIVLDLLLIPSYGVNGCAIANCLSLTFLGFRSRYLTKKVLNIESSILVHLSRSTQ